MRDIKIEVKSPPWCDHFIFWGSLWVKKIFFGGGLREGGFVTDECDSNIKITAVTSTQGHPVFEGTLTNGN